jgi:glyoxylase I family protein
MIRGIHHAAISTGNMDRLLAFYRDLLGFRVLFDFSWPAGTEVADRITGLQQSSARAVMLHTGNAIIELFQYASPAPQPGDPDRPVCNHGITHICLDVTDLDTEYQRLQAAGMRFHCPPQELGPEVRTTYGRDPDGNVIELQEVSNPDSPIALPLR